jgi:hypothetical protein
MESFGFTCKNKIIANFHILRLKKKIRLPRGVAGVAVRSLVEICIDDISDRLKGYRFEISATLRQLGWIDTPHTQNFEISRANSGDKKN